MTSYLQWNNSFAQSMESRPHRLWMMFGTKSFTHVSIISLLALCFFCEEMSLCCHIHWRHTVQAMLERHLERTRLHRRVHAYTASHLLKLYVVVNCSRGLTCNFMVQLAMTQASNQDSNEIGRFYSLFAVVFPAFGAAALYSVYCSSFHYFNYYWWQILLSDVYISP